MLVRIDAFAIHRFHFASTRSKNVPAKMVIEGLEQDATTDRTMHTLALESHARLDLQKDFPKMPRHALYPAVAFQAA